MKEKIDSSWTLFLDRDGVINVRIKDDYVRSPEDFVFLPNVPECIAFFNKKFARVVVVTNQQGIGKKIMTSSNLFEIHAYCSKMLNLENAYIDHYFFAPELTSDTNNRRKPLPSMGNEAKKTFPEIDFKKSIMVGDSETDIEFGKNCGMKTVFVSYDNSIHPNADITITSLSELKELMDQNEFEL
jgi:histidinol-phosphate phosphatase family protein